MNRYILAACLHASLILQAWAQQAQPEGDNGYAQSTIQANIGKIVFSAKDFAQQQGESDFLTSYKMLPGSQLFMTAFFEKPLAEYLPAITPELSKEEAITQGCYQFSFFVDGKQIYVGSLPPDNVKLELKQTETVLKKPFVTRPRQWSWGVSVWNLFMRNGGQQALTDGKHELKLQIRPFVQLTEVKAGPVIAEGKLSLDVLLDPPVDPDTIQLQAVKPYPGIAVSNDKFDVEKIKILKGKTDAYVFKDITSIVVLKNGQLLIEEYFNGKDRNALHDVRSVGKTFASTITGIAIGEGHLKDENQTLKSFYNLHDFANYTPKKENTSIADLLTMSSVFEGNDDDYKSAGNEENMYPTANWVKFTLDLSVDSVRKEGEWHYFTAGVVVLGDILDKRVPGGLEKYADQKLFRPLGITQYKWQYTPQKVANTAGGIQMNALDFAKFGQLYKNNGIWNGQQIIPKSWIEKSFTRHKAIPGRQNEFYGFLFWNRTYNVNGKSYETYYCAGNGGNKIYVFKDQPLVIVVTATAYGTPYGHAQVDKLMEEYVLPAVLPH
jgi:CubicO group peptidase (beta-lactamase class C family)